MSFFNTKIHSTKLAWPLKGKELSLGLISTFFESQVRILGLYHNKLLPASTGANTQKLEHHGFFIKYKNKISNFELLCLQKLTHDKET